MIGESDLVAMRKHKFKRMGEDLCQKTMQMSNCKAPASPKEPTWYWSTLTLIEQVFRIYLAIGCVDLKNINQAGYLLVLNRPNKKKHWY